MKPEPDRPEGREVVCGGVSDWWRSATFDVRMYQVLHAQPIFMPVARVGWLAAIERTDAGIRRGLFGQHLTQQGQCFRGQRLGQLSFPPWILVEGLAMAAPRRSRKVR